MGYNNYYCILLTTHWARHRSPEVPPDDNTNSSKTATKLDDGQPYVELETISLTNKFYERHQEPACIQAEPPPDGQTHNDGDTTSGAQEVIDEEENYYELPRFQ